jgi:hypothetical protein
MIIQKIKKNIAFRIKEKYQKGFALLFAVLLSSIILAIAIGVTSISLNEINFGTSGKDAGDAFFAADTGAECALFYDSSTPANNAFTGTAQMSCAGNVISPAQTSPLVSTFVVSGLGSSGNACAMVTVDKSNPGGTTAIVSKGYNKGGNGGSCEPGSNSVERELDVNY